MTRAEVVLIVCLVCSLFAWLACILSIDHGLFHRNDGAAQDAVASFFGNSLCRDDTTIEQPQGEEGIRRQRHPDPSNPPKKPRRTVSDFIAHNDEETRLRDETFGRDYEFLFIRSHVPQIIADSAGTIIAWNDAFLHLCGSQHSDMESMHKRLTIFGIVRLDYLSKTFEVFSQALCSNRDAGGHATKAWNRCVVTDNESDAMYWSCTFPCVKSFPQAWRQQQQQLNLAPQESTSPVRYLTITLMDDEDPARRHFHGMLTEHFIADSDQPTCGTELLSRLFSNNSTD